MFSGAGAGRVGGEEAPRGMEEREGGAAADARCEHRGSRGGVCQLQRNQERSLANMSFLARLWASSSALVSAGGVCNVGDGIMRCRIGGLVAAWWQRGKEEVP